MNVAHWSAVVSAVHVLGLAVGLGALFARTAASRRGELDATLRADNLWGLSALMMIPTGLIRLFGPVEKGSAYYLAHDLFLVKLGLVGTLLVLELPVMVLLIRWRIQQARGQTVDTASLSRVSVVGRVQLAILVVVPFLAAMVARGIGHTLW